jgi:hypothetical protein
VFLKGVMWLSYSKRGIRYFIATFAASSGEILITPNLGFVGDVARIGEAYLRFEATLRALPDVLSAVFIKSGVEVRWEPRDIVAGGETVRRSIIIKLKKFQDSNKSVYTNIYLKTKS